MARKQSEPPYGTPDQDSPALTEQSLAAARPFPEVMAELGISPDRLRGPHSVVVTTAVDIPVEIVEAFKAQGDGWEQRIREVLALHIKSPERSKKSA